MGLSPAPSNSVQQDNHLDLISRQLSQFGDRLSGQNGCLKEFLGRVVGLPPEAQGSQGKPASVPNGKIDSLLAQLSALSALIDENYSLLTRLSEIG